MTANEEMIRLGIARLPDEMIDQMVVSRAVDLIPRDALQKVARLVFCRMQPEERVEFYRWFSNEFQEVGNEQT